MSRLLPVALCALGLFGCPAWRSGVDRRPHDKEALATSAVLFWRSLRWGDLDTAAALIEESGPRLAFIERWSAGPPVQITDFQVVQVEVPEATGGRTGGRTEGTIVVRVEGVPLGSAVLDTDLLTQTWYREADQWYLDPESTPFPLDP